MADLTTPPAVEEGLEPSSPSTEASDNESNAPRKRSLNSIYGNRIGLLQSFSLLLNTAIMVYAHFGLSAIFVSNQQRIQDSIDKAHAAHNGTIPTNQCLQNPVDLDIWLNQGGAENKRRNVDFCSRGYKNPLNGRQCLVDTECFANCYHTQFNFSLECSACFAQNPICNVAKGCLGVCLGDPFGAECIECNLPCDDEFEVCSGLQLIREGTTAVTGNVEGAGSSTNDNTTKTLASGETRQWQQEEEPIGVLDDLDVCTRQQVGAEYENVTEYFTVYEIKFFNAIETAWYNDAQLLAVIVVIFSGFWPYTKNLLLMVAWYAPWTPLRRACLLRWMRRLGKYTLVDIYVVIILIVAVQIQLMVADETVPVIVRGEPRGGIIAFLVATVHECMHIEWMSHFHQKSIDDTKTTKADEPQEETEDKNSSGQASSTNVIASMRFQGSLSSADSNTLMCKNPFMAQVFMTFMAISALALFLAGTIMDTIRFVSTVGDDTEGCLEAFNLYSMGTALISDFSLHMNEAKPGTWTLYITYALFLMVLPLFLHSVHMLVCVFQIDNLLLCRLADISSTFASIEVFILGIFVVQHKFELLISALAGNENSEFFGIQAELGPGFYVLLVYSFVSGMLHYLFNRAVAHYYHLEKPHVDYWWTALVRGCLHAGDAN